MVEVKTININSFVSGKVLLTKIKGRRKMEERDGGSIPALRNYLLMAALDLCCCAQAFSSCSKQGLFFLVLHKLLIVVASLAAEHRLQ